MMKASKGSIRGERERQETSTVYFQECYQGPSDVLRVLFTDDV